VEFVRYLVDPRQAEDQRLSFTLGIRGEETVFRMELRNGVVVVSEAASRAAAHLELTRQEWAEFLIGRRSIQDAGEVFARFEAVLARPAPAAGLGPVDAALDDAAEDVDYMSDGGRDG
jgi:hypothetical protein